MTNAGHEKETDGAQKAPGPLRVVALNAIADVGAPAWDACANPLPHDACRHAFPDAQQSDQERHYNPFLAHSFLSALEASKSVGGHSGWRVQHVLVQAADGTLLAAAPCYRKSHSRGEYVFDYGWAEAYAQAGGSYYPKLQVAVPFTPATGNRLLLRPGANALQARKALVGGLVELCRIDGASGVHVTFATEAEYRYLGDLGFLHVAAAAVLEAVGLNSLAERIAGSGTVQAVERLNLDGLLALWHPPTGN